MRNVMMVLLLTMLATAAQGGLLVQEEPGTLGLWRCDSTYLAGGGTKIMVPDEDVTRAYDLRLVNGSDITSDGSGWDGEAVVMDGVDDFGIAAWTYQPNISIQMAFQMDNPTSGANRYLVELASMVRLYVNVNNQMALTIWDSDSVAKTITVPVALTTGWQEVYAQYGSDGLMQLFVHDQAGNLVGSKQGIYLNGSINVKTANLVIGSYRGGSHFFDGKLDEIMVSNMVPEPASLALLMLGSAALIRRKK